MVSDTALFPLGTAVWYRDAYLLYPCQDGTSPRLGRIAARPGFSRPARVGAYLSRSSDTPRPRARVPGRDAHRVEGTNACANLGSMEAAPPRCESAFRTLRSRSPENARRWIRGHRATPERHLAVCTCSLSRHRQGWENSNRRSPRFRAHSWAFRSTPLDRLRPRFQVSGSRKGPPRRPRERGQRLETRSVFPPRQRRSHAAGSRCTRGPRRRRPWQHGPRDE